MKGLSTTDKINKLIKEATLDPRHDLPRVAIIVTNSSETLYSGSGGTSHLPPLGSPTDGAPPITIDSVFQMASATKLITTIAALQIVDQGFATLDEDLRERMPDLHAAKLLKGFRESDDEAILEEITVPITLRQLLSHSAGFTYSWGPDNQAKYQKKYKIPTLHEPESNRKSITAIPLAQIPGTHWQYSTGIDWAGFFVEQVSGMLLDEYFEKHIFGPLGIKDLTFYKPDDVINLVYRQDPTSEESPIPTFVPREHFPMFPSPDFLMGGGGLFGSPSSYIKILRALLAGGKTPSGFVLLKDDTVAEMFKPNLHLEAQLDDMAAGATHDNNPWMRGRLRKRSDRKGSTGDSEERCTLNLFPQGDKVVHFAGVDSLELIGSSTLPRTSHSWCGPIFSLTLSNFSSISGKKWSP
ncbi:beta-lactamase/transpeptidase-like protein [Meredithblackwellia eburnea MCA 4105]